MKKWLKLALVVLIVSAFVLMALASGSSKTDNSGSNSHSETRTEKPDSSNETEETGNEATEEAQDKDIYKVGDTYQDKNLRMVYMASGVFESDNSYLQPDDGNVYIFLRFFVENIGSSDKNVSSFDFECYADGYNCDSFYSGDEALSATLSPGRTTTGCVYFEVPEKAEEVEVEFEADVWSSDKVKFAYEGEKDSGYVPEVNDSETVDSYKPGDVVETKELKITFISVENSESDNMFVQPKDGNHYVTFSFEFENISKSDVLVSEFSFDCFADSSACESAFFRDDDLGSVTLSPGRKTQGTVTFEVPDSAKVVELEYDEVSLFGNRIVFSAK
ncbi:MAG: DUF4352 domain-containing protein [Clostridia bacterium]|nr:DUF4352 domain-containing protein [Clostridia bacterium]